MNLNRFHQWLSDRGFLGHEKPYTHSDMRGRVRGIIVDGGPQVWNEFYEHMARCIKSGMQLFLSEYSAVDGGVRAFFDVDIEPDDNDAASILDNDVRNDMLESIARSVGEIVAAPGTMFVLAHDEDRNKCKLAYHVHL